MSAARLLALGTVLLLATWYLVAVFGPRPGPAAPPLAFESSAACADCHAEVYVEWQASQHALAWNDPAVRALSNDFANQDCIDCHAPRPVFVTGIGQRVLPRNTHRAEGVDCLACHLLPAGTEGSVAGTVTDRSAACRPVEVLDLARPELCAGCHDQHKTVQQWRESRWPERGEDCLSCHMPHRGGDPNRGRHHGFPGGNDLDFLRRAVALRVLPAAEGWVVEVENVGAGHAFPTDERSRAADVFWRPLADPPGPWRHLHRMRSPYRTETDVPDTLLQAHERRRLALDDPEAHGPVEVALFYKRSPYWRDPERPDPEHEAILVQRVVAP